MMVRKLLVALAILSSPLVVAQDLAGLWKNKELPAWIEVRFDNGMGTGTVVRNDEYPDRVGRVLLKDLRPEAGETAAWHGQIYADRLKDYTDALVALPEPDRMFIEVKVGFFSRTVEWTRVAGLPQ